MSEYIELTAELRSALRAGSIAANDHGWWWAADVLQAARGGPGVITTQDMDEYKLPHCRLGEGK